MNASGQCNAHDNAPASEGRSGFSYSEKEKQLILQMQINELTANVLYRRLAGYEKNPHNRAILEQIALDENKHYHILKRYTGQTPDYNHFQAFRMIVLSRLLGLTFGIKLQERAEQEAGKGYAGFDSNPDFMLIKNDEEIHEQQLVGMLQEEKLQYMGSVVLGLNDALVELTGALAGFTLALQQPELIALTGSITGIAAALSMASSEYLSTRSEGDGKNAIRASLYTGLAYLGTVVALIAPFLLLSNPILSLVCTLAVSAAIIGSFNYYYAVVRNESFKKRFLEMAGLSFGVAGFSFLIGYLLKRFTGIEV